MTRILLFDIESTGLKADIAELLVFGYRWVDSTEGVKVPSVLDYCKPCKCCGRIDIDERPLLKQAHALMGQADMVITFNGKVFDSKLLQTKWMQMGLPALPQLAHVDLYQVAKHNMVLTRKSLANISKYLELDNQKTALEWSTWIKAAKGHVPSLRYIRTHCKADIKVTEELYKILRPYVRQHPRVNGYGPCRRCGADALERRGSAVTIYRGQQYRYQCKACAGWETRAA